MGAGVSKKQITTYQMLLQELKEKNMIHIHNYNMEVERITGYKYSTGYTCEFTKTPRFEQEKCTKVVKRCSVCLKPKVMWLYGHQPIK